MKIPNGCSSCSKEPQGYVPIARVIERLDELAAQNDTAGLERTLDYWAAEARSLGDDRGLIVVLSEQIGHYRREGDEERGMRAINEALALLDGEETGTSEATVYLNIATTLQAFGRTGEALKYFDIVREVYLRELPPDDSRLAGYYNNYASALAALGRAEEAKEHYLRALKILSAKRNVNEVAITYVNLAKLAYDSAKESEHDDEIDGYIELAYDALNSADASFDGPYANVCNKCADAFDFHGYFVYADQMRKRAEEIYRSNRTK